MDISDLPAVFDIAAAAGWYSAVAGLLAGFALVSILLPLDHDAGDIEPGHATNAVVVFTCAFFSLLVLSISYAVLAGRIGSGSVEGVAAHEQMLNGAAFGLSTLLLLFGLHAILATYGANREVFAPARDLILTVTSVLGPLLVLGLQFSNSLDLQRFRAGGPLDGVPPGVWLNLSIVGTATAVILIVAGLRLRLPSSRTSVRTIGKTVLGYTFGITLWTSMAVPLLPVTLVTGPAMEHTVMGLTAVGTVLLSIVSWTGR